jgi:5-(hydroxymethyl)furfural/furfural oxidase
MESSHVGTNSKADSHSDSETLTTTFLVVGGGTAGCVMASRLSEDPGIRVILVEAGRDYAPSDVPADISASYAGHALYNPTYFWPDMKVWRRSNDARPLRYEQARIMGGGSSINGQVALRGSPADYDRWDELGAKGWNWSSVLPYFRKLETDLDFTDQHHGAEGPIGIRRLPEKDWDTFTKSVVTGWAAAGYMPRPDMNGSFEEGYAPIPVSHDGKQRRSVVVGYLSEEVRKRPNLMVLPETEVTRLLLDGRRCVGAEAKRGGRTISIGATRTILCAGSLRSPWLLMKSGIGPAAQLAASGITPLLDVAGVGQNLQDHAMTSIVAYKAPGARLKAIRHNYVNLLYSSRIPGTPSADMVMSAVCKTAWHALGDRLGALSTYVGKPFSRGSVKLDREDAFSDPVVTFDWLSDDRDLARAALGFRNMAKILRSDAVRGVVLETFAAGFSARVKKIGALTPANKILTSLAAIAMDASARVRHELIRKFAADGPDLDTLLSDEGELFRYLRATATGIWHPSGTCRMGAHSDPAAVVDSKGAVIGIDGLSVADASIIPEIPTTNINIPTIMIAERISDFLKQDLRGNRRLEAQPSAA